MEARRKVTAVITTLGMLHEVDVSPIIRDMMGLATKRNPNLDVLSKLAACMKLGEQFNLGEIAPEEFAAKVLSTLDIDGCENMNAERFLSEWNSIVRIQGVKEKISNLNAFCAESNSLVYLYSDTNEAHLNKIQSEYRKIEIKFERESLSTPPSSCKPGCVQNFPFYTTCFHHLSRVKLVEKMITDIQSKHNKPEKIVIVFGDPENIQNPQLKARAEAEKAALEKLCSTPDITLVLHKKSAELVDTLKHVFQPVVEEKKDEQPSVRYASY